MRYAQARSQDVASTTLCDHRIAGEFTGIGLYGWRVVAIIEVVSRWVVPPTGPGQGRQPTYWSGSC